MKLKCLSAVAVISLLIISCSKNDNSTNTSPSINFTFKFDSTQARLDNIGQPAPIISGHAAQSPRFNTMSAHYIEFAPDALTPLGSGQVIYKAPETTLGGANAINFSESKFAGNNQVFLTVPLSSLAPGTYKWLRVSLAYQNYDIYINALGQKINTTVASFIGYRSYVTNFKIKDSMVTVNSNKDQGFWAFEARNSGSGYVQSGQAPAGATTVPNPIFNTSPIPAGSCVVTGSFPTAFVITGSEKNDINIIISLSTNKSFEWIDADGNTTYDPLNGDRVIDMGIRGMLPYRQ